MQIQHAAAPAEGGSDSNDGSSWDTPKATWRGAYEAVESGGLILVKDGVFWQTDTTKGCLIVGPGDPNYAAGLKSDGSGILHNAGWMKSKPVTTVGIPTSKAQLSCGGQAFMFGGGSYVDAANPNPCVWLVDATGLNFENILVRGDQPVIIGTRALDATVSDQNCNVTQATFRNFVGQCLENFNSGPALRIATSIFLHFENTVWSGCGISPLINPTSPVGKPAITWSGYAYRPWRIVIKIIAGGNETTATFKWSTDGGLNFSVSTLTAGAHVQLVSSAGNNVGINGSGVSGPPGHEVYADFAAGTYVANDLYTVTSDLVDKTCAVLLDGFAPGATFRNTVLNGGNMRLRTPSTGNQSGVTAIGMLFDSSIGTIGKPTIEVLGTSNTTRVFAMDISSADVDNGPCDLYCSPQLPASSVVGIGILFQQGGIHLGGEYDNSQKYKAHSLIRDGGFGLSREHSQFRADHGRRLFGPVGAPVKNLACFEPALWATSAAFGPYSNSATIVAGPDVAGPDGTLKAHSISSPSGTTAVNFVRNLTLHVGDGLVFGVWCRGGPLASPYTPPLGVDAAGFTFTLGGGDSVTTDKLLNANLPWSGDATTTTEGEWHWVSCIGIITGLTTGGAPVSSKVVDVFGQLRCEKPSRAYNTFYAPVMLQLLATQFSANEMYEIHLGLGPMSEKIPAGGIGFLPGQDLFLPRRLLTQGAPTFAAPTMGAGAGTTPGAVTITGDETQCKVSFTTGTTPTAGAAIMTVTFPNGAFADAAGARTPMVTVEPGNAAASLVNVFATETSTTFVLTAPTGVALAASTAYVWKCRIVG